MESNALSSSGNGHKRNALIAQSSWAVELHYCVIECKLCLYLAELFSIAPVVVNKQTKKFLPSSGIHCLAVCWEYLWLVPSQQASPLVKSKLFCLKHLCLSLAKPVATFVLVHCLNGGVLGTAWPHCTTWPDGAAWLQAIAGLAPAKSISPRQRSGSVSSGSVHWHYFYAITIIFHFVFLSFSRLISFIFFFWAIFFQFSVLSFLTMRACDFLRESVRPMCRGSLILSADAINWRIQESYYSGRVKWMAVANDILFLYLLPLLLFIFIWIVNELRGGKQKKVTPAPRLTSELARRMMTIVC